MHKLTNIEAQRVMSVLGEMLDRLNYLTYIPLKPELELLDMLQENRCQSSCDQLKNQWQYEEAHRSTINDNGHCRDSVLRQLLHIGSDDLVFKIQVATRNLCRDLRENPVAVETLYNAITGIRNTDMLTLVQTLSELTDLTYQKFLSTAEDENMKKKILNGVSYRKKHAEGELAVLQEKLNQLRKVKDDEVAQLESQINKLRTEIFDINQNSAYELGLIENEMKENLERQYDDHVTVITELQEHLAQLQLQFEKCSKDHCEEEALLRKKKCKTAADLAVIVEKYDCELGEKTTMMEELQVIYDDELKKYSELQEYFKKIDEEQSRIDSEEKVLEEIRAKDRAAQKLLHDSATKIQKIFRGNIARKNYKKISSKKKKGKKGKKK